MGVCYSVVCHDCKVMRDLGKFYTMFHVDESNRATMLAELEEWNDHYRGLLLATFMGTHKGHMCSIVDDCSDAMMDLGERGYVADVDYWREADLEA